MSEFAAVDVIRAKRDGHRLSDAQIDWVVDAYTRGIVADEQMSALAMAILLRGMTPAEIARWTARWLAGGGGPARCGAGHGHPAARDDAGRDRPLDGRDDRQRGAPRPELGRAADRGQAL